MLIFWWQGKGFLTPLVLVVVIAVGSALADTLHLPSYTAWFWAGTFIIAAPINWLVGRRLNRKRRKSLGLLSPLKQLTYRARNKFMSLPMESWSVVMLIASALCALRGAIIP